MREMPVLLRTALGAHLQSFGRRNFVVWTPIWVNQNSISCVSMISMQWFTLYHHLRYFYLVILVLSSLTPAKHRFTKTHEIMLVDPLYLRDNYV
jgi:hypothetical protein